MTSAPSTRSRPGSATCRTGVMRRSGVAAGGNADSQVRADERLGRDAADGIVTTRTRRRRKRGTGRSHLGKPRTTVNITPPEFNALTIVEAITCTSQQVPDQDAFKRSSRRCQPSSRSRCN